MVETATIKCPECGAEAGLEVPENACGTSGSAQVVGSS